MRFALLCVLWLVVLQTPRVATAQPEALDLRTVPAYPNLKFERPLWLGHVPGTPNHVLVVEQAGRVWAFPATHDVRASDRILSLDFAGDPVSRDSNEEGMLGFAFHPDFVKNRYVYIHYSARSPRRGVVSRFKMSRSLVIDPASEHTILEVPQPYWNHNGGMIAFGPEDGYLYISLGDGGAGGDPKGHGQDLRTLLGTILRIDVDQSANGKPYAIPEDNPFVEHAEARPEIYAYGLRNAWRFSFDDPARGGDGALWAGDVGQNQYEEIDLIVKGGNYGWNVREGTQAFKRGKMQPDFVDPVIDYPVSDGKSVTGGYVYRGQAIPALQGAYVYADYASGRVWALKYDAKRERVLWNRQVLQVTSPASFGVDKDGELYITSFSGKILWVRSK